ncbi:MAG: DJ-1/PfpI family protein [Nanoarchaeota archaeon]
MVTILMVIAKHNFRDEEYLIPRELFRRSGYDIITASVEKSICTGMLGAQVMPDRSFEDVSVDSIDVVIVCGGSGAPELSKSSHIMSILQEAHHHNKLIAAICYGSTVLAKAGILKACKATTWKDDWAIQELQKSGAVYTGKDVEVDHHIITASGPRFAKEFAEEVIKQISIQPREGTIKSSTVAGGAGL